VWHVLPPTGAETLVDYADDDQDTYILSDPAPGRGPDQEARVTCETRRSRAAPHRHRARARA
jgi:hypothetical protein